MQMKCQCFGCYLARIQSEIVQGPFFSWAAVRVIAPHSQPAPSETGSHSGAVSALLIIILCFSTHLHARLERSLIHDEART